jgi:hypothetical protein
MMGYYEKLAVQKKVLADNDGELPHMENENEAEYDIMEDMLDGTGDTGTEGKYAVKSKPKYTYEEAISSLLDDKLKVTRDKRKERASTKMAWQIIQTSAVVRYLQYCAEGIGKMDASVLVANFLYPRLHKGQYERGSYKPRTIRFWGAEYLEKGILVEYKQGQHTKTNSIITDEHVQITPRASLRFMKDEHRTPANFRILLIDKHFLRRFQMHRKKLASAIVRDG